METRASVVIHELRQQQQHHPPPAAGVLVSAASKTVNGHLAIYPPTVETFSMHLREQGKQNLQKNADSA